MIRDFSVKATDAQGMAVELTCGSGTEDSLRRWLTRQGYTDIVLTEIPKPVLSPMILRQGLPTYVGRADGQNGEISCALVLLVIIGGILGLLWRPLFWACLGLAGLGTALVIIGLWPREVAVDAGRGQIVMRRRGSRGRAIPIATITGITMDIGENEEHGYREVQRAELLSATGRLAKLQDLDEDQISDLAERLGVQVTTTVHFIEIQSGVDITYGA
jgi:hypothetical protein